MSANVAIAIAIAIAQPRCGAARGAGPGVRRLEIGSVGPGTRVGGSAASSRFVVLQRADMNGS